MTYRNPRLLRLAKEAPHCMSCGRFNDGSIVAAHSNQIAHGKGIGTKSHDLTAYLCSVCHDRVDGRIESEWTRQEREEMWWQAFYKSMLWLLESGHLHVGCKCDGEAA